MIKVKLWLPIVLAWVAVVALSPATQLVIIAVLPRLVTQQPATQHVVVGVRQGLQ